MSDPTLVTGTGTTAGTDPNATVAADPAAASATASTTPTADPAKTEPTVGGFDSSKLHLEVTPEVGFGVDVWGAGKENDSYTSFEFKLGPKFRYGADKGPNVWVKPSFVYRGAGKDIENSGDAPQSAEFVEPSDTTSTGAEAGEDPFGNDISTTGDEPNENLNYSDATKETLKEFGGEFEVGTDFTLKNNDKIRWTVSPSLFFEGGGGSGYVDLLTHADGLQKVGGFIGVGARVATGLKIKGNVVDVDLGVGGDLGTRQVMTTVPGDTASPDTSQWGWAGGASFMVGVTPHKKRSPSTTPTTVNGAGQTTPGTFSADEIQQIESATTTGTVVSANGITTIDTSKVELKDTKNRPVIKIVLVYDDTTKNYLVKAWVKRDPAVADDPTTTDIDESLELSMVEINGINVNYTKPGDFITALLAITAPTSEATSTPKRIDIATGYFFETSGATTLYKGADASLGKINGNVDGTVIVEVNGVTVSEIPFMANMPQEVTIKSDKLSAMANGPIAVTIRLKDVSGIRRITGYTVADKPQILTLDNAHVKGADHPPNNVFVADDLVISFNATSAGKVEVTLPGRTNKVTKDIVAGVGQTITINSAEYEGSKKRGAPGKVTLTPIAADGTRGTTSVETTEIISIGKKSSSRSRGSGA